MAKSDTTAKVATSFKDVAKTPTDHEAMARDIILAISHELHVRVGIGPIWRQLNAARKKELIDAWTYKTVEILSK